MLPCASHGRKHPGKDGIFSSPRTARDFQRISATEIETKEPLLPRRGFPPFVLLFPPLAMFVQGGGVLCFKGEKGEEEEGDPTSLLPLCPPPPKKKPGGYFFYFPFPAKKKVTRADTLSSPPSPSGGEVILRVVPQQRDECGSGWVR